MNSLPLQMVRTSYAQL